MQRLLVASIATLMCLPTMRSASAGKADAFAFAYYMQSLSARVAARTCARGIQGFDERFDRAFKTWHARHADAIARGERVFLEGISSTENPSDGLKKKLASIERARELLSKPDSEARTPLPDKLSESYVAWCESIIQSMPPD